VEVTLVRAPVRVLAVTTVLVVLLLPACGGGSKSTPPPFDRPPVTVPVDPCATAAAAAEAPQDDATDEPQPPAAVEKRAAHRARQARDRRGRVLDSLWLHQARGSIEAPLAGTASVAQDVGEVAVLQDAGDLFLLPNTFDLAGISLQFTPLGGGFAVARAASTAFRSTLGTRLTLEDDDSEGFTLPFPFTYYGRAQSRIFVNSDGNLTFEEEDRASTERDITRVLSGPPRIAPFFTDLDPSAAGGRVFVQSAADAFTVTWCGVRGFDATQTVTTQVSVLPDGGIEMRYGQPIGLTNAIVAVGPGRTSGFATVDLSVGGSTTNAAAVGERFGSQREIDLVAVARRFYQDHPDLYDQLLIWTDTSLTTDAFAFETTVKNEIHGLGIDVYDNAAAFGSAGRLRSLVMMDALSKYPDDPQQTFLGENDTVSLMGQEVGHRWLAFLHFRDASGGDSEALLGRDKAHWSFFMDSDASVMEGNDIDDLGGGTFRTKGAVSRYSRLDQYAMGLIGESDVPPFFYVESPTNVQPSRTATSAPEIGVTFSGTRRTVLISDVVAAMGARSPSFRDSPRVHRQAFLYVTSSGTTLAGADVTKIDGFRRAWETFFAHAVDNRMRAETRLR